MSDSDREDLVKELENYYSIGKDYANVLSSLLLQFKTRVAVLDDDMQFLSDTERVRYLVETIAIMEQFNGYALMCKTAVNKCDEIVSKLGL